MDLKTVLSNKTGDTLPAPRKEKTRWTVDELLSTDFPDPAWVINQILPTGEGFLSGRPKLGKSWLALQMAAAVSSGGYCLEYQAERGEVLYLALEDRPRRLASRLKKQNIKDANITFELFYKTVQNGGFEDLLLELENDRYKLVVIDTLSRFLGRSDQGDLGEMTTVIGGLQQLAQSRGVGLLLVDHHRKQSGFDVDLVDDILGSTGKAATADTILGLYRERGKQGATLKLVGRDVEDLELALEWDGYTCTWKNMGEANGVRTDSFNHQVMSAIVQLESMGELATTTKISLHCGAKKSNVSRAIGELIALGKIIRGEKVNRDQPYKLVVHDKQ